MPFRHFRASQVFNPIDYQSLASAFSRVLQEVNSDPKQQYNVERYNNYDALVIGMDARLSNQFKPLFESSWIEELSRLMGIPFLPRISGALHSHPVNSRTGWIHSDYCPVWFDESVKQFESELLYPDHSRCEYFTGKSKVADALPKEYIRSASMIFYLCNDGWQEDEGGETVLYEAAHSHPYRAVEFIPPVNNSLLFFEISPYSFHTFITNRVRSRNSIILFLHSTIEFAKSRWGNSLHQP